MVRWRCVDIQRWIEAEYKVHYHERTIGKLLHALNLSHVSTRPLHPESDVEVQAAFKKTLTPKSRKSSPDTPLASVSKSGFRACPRVGQKGTLTYVWGETGTRPRAIRDQRYECAYIFGAVCPARGVGAALVMPHADTHAMNAHLVEISSQVAYGAHAIVIIDGAGWHTTKSLKTPDNISLLRLPAYSPELNPQENIWQYLRQNALANRTYETYDSMVTAMLAEGVAKRA